MALCFRSEELAVALLLKTVPGVTEIDMPFSTQWKSVIGRDRFYSVEFFIRLYLCRAF